MTPTASIDRITAALAFADGVETLPAGGARVLAEQRDAMLAALGKVRTWLELNGRRESVVYGPVCAAIEKARGV